MKRILSLTAISLFLWGNLNAQDNNMLLSKGDKLTDKFKYEDALYFYETANSLEPNDPNITRRIASTYRKLGELQESKQWYQKTLEMDTSNPEDMLYYAEALKSLQQYDESIMWYAKYAGMVPEDSRAQSHISDPYYHIDLHLDSLKYRIKPLQINATAPAFGVCRFGEQYLFSSSGINPDYEIGSTEFMADPYLDIFVCEKDLNDEFILANKLEGEINSKYHDGPVFFDENYMEMFITRNNVRNGKPQRDENGNVNLKIVSSTLVGNEWTPVKELSVNSDEYSCGHPCLTEDGETMIFVSNMSGGIGGTDLYMSHRTPNGWSTPINLGDNINTEGDEMFPHVSENGTIYFASNGHAGLGGMDIFMSENIEGEFQHPVNLGYPINTNHDDFSILYDAGAHSGYFASNRGGKGSDDIYFFSTLKLLTQIVTGTIESDIEGVSYAGEKIEVKSFKKAESEFYTLDEYESFEIEVVAGDEIAIYMADIDLNIEKPVFKYKLEEQIEDPYQNVGDIVLPEELVVRSTAETEINEALAENDSQRKLEEAAAIEEENAPSLRDQEGIPSTEEAQNNVALAENHAENLLVATQANIEEDQSALRDELLALKDSTNEMDGDEVSIPEANNYDDSGLNATMLTAQSPDGAFTESMIELQSQFANIYFPFDKDYIGLSAAPVLDKMADLMRENEAVVIEIDTHCDSRGTDGYNLGLSQRRAENVKRYLVWKGVGRNQIQLKWHGEGQLVNHCSNDIQCAPEDHQQNRRAEFRVVQENVTVMTD